MENTDSKENERVHVLSLSATKLGDGLVDPKLVLAWLLTYVGAGPVWIGLLVPVREAGALLPQLFTAERLRSVPVRKWWWVIGSVVQGVAVLGMALSGLWLSGDFAGFSIIFCLTIFALARSICSVSYKDVLGKTVVKPRRGFVSGVASSFAAAGVFIFGLLLLFSILEREVLVFGALILASVLWFIAALQFSRLEEQPSEPPEKSSEPIWKQYVGYVVQDRELQKFILARGLLTATAIAPPFLLLLAQTPDSSLLTQLGGLVVASSLATTISGTVWGRMSDYSTKITLIVAGFSAAVLLLLALVAAIVGLYTNMLMLPIILFGLIVAYQGVRIARTVHLVNLASEQTRAAYTAISNTIIGIVLLGTGVFGILAAYTSVEVVVGSLALMSLAGGVVALRFE